MSLARTVRATAIPSGSVIATQLPGAQFADCFETADPLSDTSALQTWLDMVIRTPGWTRALMALRNRLVSMVGLKGVGQLHDGTRRSAAGYRVGDQVGFFEIRHLGEREVVMGVDDRHLNVLVSLHKRMQDGQAVLALSSVVHIHNALGHTYMATIAPFHRLIVRTLLARLDAAAPASTSPQRPPRA
ncbi:Protein of unknown function (DUF2867) [Acidovorax sp. CF316]|uniref:DUF2867 domain-containing protein n=1 Tax=Acidovorax sp. CF316 TaxID=1144317 RepID=UPI00026BC25C|nr:DUF2867 domain-containing protein [Acidovorax sp. CF316]EJE54360.1 Protein of unknown function (DUF2867) [Acidovorax sp. CF316]